MPRGFVAISLNWLATHLVSIILIGFLVTGLLLADVIRLPSHPVWNLPDAATPRPAVTPDTDLPGQGGPVFEELRPGQPQSAARKAPKLIGGSLPVHGEARYDSGSAPAPPDGSVGGFRPPTAGATVPETVGVGRDDLLQQARRAFWNNDFGAAEAAYINMVAAFPGDADAFGELGNLYEAMGKPSQALDAYYEAGIRLRAAGDTAKLQQVIDLFERNDDPRVGDLRR